MQRYDKYRDLVDNFDDFLSVLQTPLPMIAWRNPLRLNKRRAELLLNEAKMSYRELEHSAGAYEVRREQGFGNWFGRQLGFFHVQEEAALLAAKVLGAQPGERVLDMCAAPGNKTAWLGAQMQQSGVLVANEPVRSRLSLLRRSIERLGLINVAITTYDGGCFPGRKNELLFDRVLADVPCSCEGTVRKHPRVGQRENTASFAENLQRLQVNILTRAIKLCKPGGRIVYSTCTFSPRENELVVDRVLRKNPDRVRIVPVKVDGIRFRSGLTTWQGENFLPDVAHAARLWPQDNDTGGFFVAAFERTSFEPYDDYSESGVSGNVPEEPREIIGQLWQQYQFPESLRAEVKFSQLGNRRIVAASPETFTLFGEHKFETYGLNFARTGQIKPKITTVGALAFGKFARRNFVVLTAEQLEPYLAGGEFRLAANQLDNLDSGRYVVVMHPNASDLCIGTGWTDGTNLKSLLPKAWIK